MPHLLLSTTTVLKPTTGPNAADQARMTSKIWVLTQPSATVTEMTLTSKGEVTILGHASANGLSPTMMTMLTKTQKTKD